MALLQKLQVFVLPKINFVSIEWLAFYIMKLLGWDSTSDTTLQSRMAI